MTLKVGIIGCGNMGSALTRGMVEARLLPASRIVGYDADPAKSRRLARGLRIKAARSAREAAACSVVLLAVKPQQMSEVLEELRPHLRHKPRVISIAAGIPIGWIERKLGVGIPVIRVMPNMPALVRQGISAIAAGRFAHSADQRFTERLLRTVGEVVRVSERQMDAVTAVSGSGPAYFFYLIEQMIRAGQELGLPRAKALTLAIQTAEGAARMALTGADPSALRAAVTSRGGTTEAALRLFEKRGLGKIIRAGIHAAARRSKELSH